MNIAELLDRPIAFQRPFVALGVGITGALMLSQAVYWARRTSDENGWFYKSQEEWTEETGLSRYEQEGARKKLCSLGVLEEDRRGVPARLYYRVNMAELSAQLQCALSPETSMWEGSNPDCGNSTIKNAERSQASKRKTSKQDAGKPAIIHTENTTETTAESTAETTTGGGAGSVVSEVLPKSKQAKPEANIEALPEWIPVDAWVAFCEMRKAMGAKGKLTERAAKLIVNELEKLAAQGHDPRAVLEQSVINNWRGVFPVKNGNRQQSLEARNRSAADEFVRGGR